VQTEGEEAHQHLEEAEEERDAADPPGLDLQHEGDLLGAAVGPLVALDGVAAGVGGWDVGIGFYVTSTKVLYLVPDPTAISANRSD